MRAESLEPYVAYNLYADEEPRFSFSIEGIRWCHHPSLQYLLMVSFDVRDGERILFHHGNNLHILYGANLQGLAGMKESIETYRVFNPARHLPVADTSAPIIRRHELKEHVSDKLGQAFTAPHLRLLDD